VYPLGIPIKTPLILTNYNNKYHINVNGQLLSFNTIPTNKTLITNNDKGCSVLFKLIHPNPNCPNTVLIKSLNDNDSFVKLEMNQ